MTSRGSLLRTRAFREEDAPTPTAAVASPHDRMLNDDRIRNCCVHLADGAPAVGADGALRVLLVSNDQNLRVKALAARIPAATSDGAAQLIRQAAAPT